jgi:hypothetical protein
MVLGLGLVARGHERQGGICCVERIAGHKARTFSQRRQASAGCFPRNSTLPSGQHGRIAAGYSFSS